MTNVSQAVLDRERAFAGAFRKAALRGVRLDRDQVEKLIAEHTGGTDEHKHGRKDAQERVAEATNGEIQNPKSNAQVGPYLAATGRYELPLSAKTGKPGAGKGVLEPYAYLGDALAADILEYRRHDTALGLHLEPRKLLLDRGDGRCRTTILTLAADTGRTSSRDLNLQQVSRQGGMRACHLADEGCLIVSADFSSVELRVAAALSGDSGMREMIRLGDLYPDRKKEFDFHWRTAISVWGLDATKENRYTAKRINFQKLYGGAPPGCAANVGIPLPVAESVFRAFDVLAPGYGAWDREQRRLARSGVRSYTAYSGRTIWLPRRAEHATGNYMIQGTARELLVDAVARWRQGPWRDALIVPVHDELLAFDIPEGEAEDATAYLVQCMETEINGVAIVAEANKPSPFWLDAS